MYTRTQFPLTGAHAISVHKSQGMTPPKVVIDIGSREFAPGLTCVALSRTRKLQDIMIVKSYPKSRFDTVAKSSANKLRAEFIKKYFENSE